MEEWIREAGEDYIIGESWDELKHVRQAADLLLVLEKPGTYWRPDHNSEQFPSMSVLQVTHPIHYITS